MHYEEAAAYLNSFVNYERTHNPQAMRGVKLERMRRLCQRLGDPQRRFRSVLVTGTNGKGSICAMLYSMLRESSLQVGLYTSPHLEHMRERIRVWTGGAGSDNRVHGEDWIGEPEFAAIMEQLQPVLEEMRSESPGDAPTYFEVLTAIAFVHFNQRQVEVAVLEVGLGGRLDATNVVDQAVSIVAPIDVDHAEILGRDPVTIAKEKAGVIKPGQVVIMAPQQEGVAEVLRATCDAQGVPLFTCGQDLTVGIHRHDLDGLQVSITGLRGIYESLEIPFMGRHQAENATAAVGALEALSNTGIPSSLVEQGLAQAEWPGRLEVLHDAPLVMMDGAHNPHAAAALRKTLTELCHGRAIHLLIGMSSDKSVEEVGRLLGELAVSATCTKSRHPRALDPTDLAKRLFPFCHDVHVMSDPADAYTYLLNAVSSNDVIVVTGSLFLVGELRAALRQSHVRPKRPLVGT
jgi:dihydrofolate synthase/folylpolyglutamate synthase